jgi:hypothetical protein
LKSADAPATKRRGTTMTMITANNPGNVTARFDAAFAAVIGFCADFFAGARQGREIEASYCQLASKSTPDLAKLGLTRSEIACAALRGTRH